MKNRLLIIGNAPIVDLPKGFYNTVFFFPNNSNYVSSVNTSNVIGVLQDFTMDPGQWTCDVWGDLRRNKFIKYKTNFLESYRTIIIGDKEVASKHDVNFNIVEQITHKVIVSYVLRNIRLFSLFQVIGLKGFINYLLVLLNIRKKIPAKYRVSSGFFIALLALTRFKKCQLDLVGFSIPGSEYFVTSDVILNRSPHFKMDSLIYNYLMHNCSKFYL